MSEYTKGPWRVEPDMRSNRIGDMWSDDGYEEYCAGYNIVAEGGDEIVGCEGIVDGDDANAKLIAAAPEMLEALRMVLQHGRIDDSESRMNIVAGAISNATKS